MSNSFILPIDWTLSGTTTPGQGGPWSNGNEEVHRIPQNSKGGVSPTDSLMLYPGPSLGGLTLLLRYSQCILQIQPTRQREFRETCSFYVYIYTFRVAALKGSFFLRNSSISNTNMNNFFEKLYLTHR